MSRQLGLKEALDLFLTFEQLTRALDITGPLISLLSMLSMLYNVATTLAVMAVAYALVCLMWQYIASRRRVS